MQRALTQPPSPVRKHTEHTAPPSPLTPAAQQHGFPFGPADANADDARVRQYEAQRDRLTTAIQTTSTLLTDLATFNAAAWPVRYPSGPAFSAAPAPQRRTTLGGPLASLPSAADEGKGSCGGFSVLKLDVSAGRRQADVLPSLEQASITTLLGQRIALEQAHLAALRARVEDTASSVLVTGDLNAGKSTFVNALLRRDVMPVDEQPLTSAFCAVLDAAANGGVEEVHRVVDGREYSVEDGETYTTHGMDELEELVADVEDGAAPLKVYVADGAARAHEDAADGAGSILHNGQVDISLIDAPGLNRDSLQTTSVLARQDAIDVVVFCVSAANHFTLSAKEFLWAASNEKAFLFIVVNRFDQVRDKDRCKRLVLEQVRALSPRTWEERDELVHFVDSNRIMMAAGLNTPLPSDPNTAAFHSLERALRSFVLDKRAQSKLLPAQTFVTHLLADLDLLASANVRAALSARKEAERALEDARPKLEGMYAGKGAFERALETAEDESVHLAADRTRARLSAALASVAAGTLAPETALSFGLELPAYPGLLELWDYARDVKRALVRSLDASVKLAEDDVRGLTAVGVSQVGKVGDVHLPEGVERPKKVFRPEAMFARRTASVGNVGVGLQALERREEMTALVLADVFDVQAQLARLAAPFVGGSSSDKAKAALVDGADAGAQLVPYTLSALGALGLVGGKTLATRSVVEALVRLADVFRAPAARRLLAPALALATVALGAYVVRDLPAAVPRRIGRNVVRSLTASSAAVDDDDEPGWVKAHEARLAGETKRVLRASAWAVKREFDGALVEREGDVKRAEEGLRKAEEARGWFEDVLGRTEGVRREAGWTKEKLAVATA